MFKASLHSEPAEGLSVELALGERVPPGFGFLGSLDLMRIYVFLGEQHLQGRANWAIQFWVQGLRLLVRRV